MRKKNSFIKTVISGWVVFILISSFFLAGEGYDLNERINHHSYPKLFNQIQNYIPTSATITEAANWDLLVLDAEVSANYPEYLGETGTIRSINPHAVIVFYFSAADVIPGNTATINAGFLAGLDDDWYMKDINGDIYLLFELYAGFWTRLLNLSTGVNAYMPTYLNGSVVATGLGDGIFYDWINDDVSWVNDSASPSAAMDIDNDGVADSDTKLDSMWVQGTQTLLTNSVNTFPAGTLVTGNGGWVFSATYPGVMNGRMVENFLEGDAPGITGFDWHSVMRGHYTMHLISVDPKLSMIMANGDETDYKFMRFALCSVLMLDGYYCYTNKGTYETTRWYDEYSVNIYTGKAVKSLSCKGYLGSPVSDAYDVDNTSTYLKNLLTANNKASAQKVWRRNFANGIVLVNPTTASKTVSLGGSYRKINGTIDPSVNNGGTVTSVTLASESGIVLLNASPGTQPAIGLNREQLNFGAVSGGAGTDTQAVLISNTGGGSLSWTATDDASWLSLSPAAGESGNSLYVSVNPGQLGAGTYTGTVTVSDPKASNSPRTVDVTLTVYRSNGSASPFGDFATPLEGANVSSSIAVTGWVLDDIGVESVKIYNGPDYVGDAIFVEGARTDIEQAYPDYPQNYQAGWGYMLLTNFLPNGGNGTYTLYAKATDREGHVVTLGSSTITVDNANAVKPFGAIDTPTQGGTASGGSFTNAGWALTPMPNKIPEDGSTIQVYVDGAAKGTVTYNQYREDIATLFPGYANSGGALAYKKLDTTAYANGVHSIYWIAVDNAGNADGIGSRFFTIQNAQNRSKSSWTPAAGTKSGYAPSVPTGTRGLADFTVDASSPVAITMGFGRETEQRAVYLGDNGIITIKIKELERLEIRLDDGYTAGYTQVGKELRALPAGSTLDAEKGIFHWIPAPGFVGDYVLTFVNEENRLQRVITIQIVPKKG